MFEGRDNGLEESSWRDEERESGCIYLVSFWRKVMRSLRSLFFLRPPKAILVPGMYFLGFSRYSNCVELAYYAQQ